MSVIERGAHLIVPGEIDTKNATTPPLEHGNETEAITRFAL